MARSSSLTCTLLAVLLIPTAVAASTAPTTPTFLIKWGQAGTAPGSFNVPSGMTTDALGNVYVCDQFNHRIQKFDRLGNFLHQWGTSGSGAGQFNQPFGIAIDATGFIYVSDNGNHRIQKFTSAGVFVTAWGSQGNGNGQFQAPLGLTLDAQGDVYVADQFNHRIQRFTSSGTFVTKFGTNGFGTGQFILAVAVAVDATGNVFAVDSNNNRIQKWTKEGVYQSAWGGSGSADGQFSGPIGVAVDPLGNVYVVDRGNNRIQKFTGNGAFLTKWGTNGSSNGQFAVPLGITVDGAGHVYVAEQNNQRVQKFSGAGEALSEPAPSLLLSWSGFTYPTSIATDAAGNVFVEHGGAWVRKLSSTGEIIVQISLTVFGIATDPSGNVFVASGNEIRKYNNALSFIGAWGSLGSGPGQFNGPYGVGTDASGNVYVADSGNNRIQKFTNTGTFVTAWGSPGTGNGQFDNPFDVAVDASGNVYTLENGTFMRRIQKLSSSGVYITQWGGYGSGDSQFEVPTAIHVDAPGNVYVADIVSNRVKKFTGAGAYVTAWVVPTARGVATDAAGNVYVAEHTSHRVLKFVAPPTVALVSDVRNDQGRNVRLRVLRSSGDVPGSGVTIPRYDVFRRIDALPAPQGLGVEGGSPSQVDLAGWEQVGSFNAYGESEYNIVVPTLADATSSSLEYSAYMVRAATDTPFNFYDSGIANGFSVDNLPPSTPTPFMAAFEAEATHLHWGISAAADFETFRLHRGTSSEFIPGAGNLIATTPDTGYADPGAPGSWYKLTAVDRNGNQSSYAVLGPEQTTDTPAPGHAFALDGMRPSPARGERLVVHFALASSAPAKLDLIDVAGRLVRTRAVGALGAGRHTVDLGEEGRVPPGIWFIRLTQGPNQKVMRAIVLD